MTPRAKTWTCRRQDGGVPCLHVNPSRNRVCKLCGKKKPARKRPAHMVALDLPYEAYIVLNGGEHCGICKAPPPTGKRTKLDRDHEHAAGGRPRGLLCRTCNRKLRVWLKLEWLRAAVAYLERAA